MGAGHNFGMVDHFFCWGRTNDHLNSLLYMVIVRLPPIPDFWGPSVIGSFLKNWCASTKKSSATGWGALPKLIIISSNANHLHLLNIRNPPFLNPEYLMWKFPHNFFNIPHFEFILFSEHFLPIWTIPPFLASVLIWIIPHFWTIFLTIIISHFYYNFAPFLSIIRNTLKMGELLKMWGIFNMGDSEFWNGGFWMFTELFTWIGI